MTMPVSDIVGLEPESRAADVRLPVVVEFAAGVEGVVPSPEVVAMAGRLAQAVVDYTGELAALVVDVDGALSIDLRLNDGLLLLAELSVDGYFDASVYDDKTGKAVRELRLPRATEAQFLDLLR